MRAREAKELKGGYDPVRPLAAAETPENLTDDKAGRSGIMKSIRSYLLKEEFRSSGRISRRIGREVSGQMGAKTTLEMVKNR